LLLSSFQTSSLVLAYLYTFLPGVHWGYEETKIFLGILGEPYIHEKLRTCHRNRQVYRIVAERLRECGFLRTLEQCRYRFKNLQTNYHKARSSHTLVTCPFYDKMDALMSPWALANTFDALEVAGGLLQNRGDSKENQKAMLEGVTGDGNEVEEEPRSLGAQALRGSPNGKLSSSQCTSGWWERRRPVGSIRCESGDMLIVVCHSAVTNLCLEWPRQEKNY
ncbi:zinc finger and SCAN domain-containing protein 20-like, partial [Diceros bicornis minor]|uniref:zinc finger and SCAN domain-containing protein 20-like n=1 Tax=Diceros bicornis minor TaxID=77932 RepID=UPI0026EF409D